MSTSRPTSAMIPKRSEAYGSMGATRRGPPLGIGSRRDAGGRAEPVTTATTTATTPLPSTQTQTTTTTTTTTTPAPAARDTSTTSTAPMAHDEEPHSDHSDPEFHGARATDAAAAGKRSRYLREMDRREILARIEVGERQSVLAKEFGVSRAAISNLVRQRDVILARKDEDPYAKHPKRSRATPPSMPVAPATQEEDDDRPGISSTIRHGVRVVQSRPMTLLLTTLHDAYAPTELFRRHTTRLLRLLLEESIANVPIQPIEVHLTETTVVPGYRPGLPPCAISTESGESPMLEAFQEVEPHRPSGVMLVRDDDYRNGHPDVLPVRLLDAQLPRSLQTHNVFVLVPIASSAERISIVIRALRRLIDAREANCVVVCVTIAIEVIELLQRTHPQVRISTAEVDMARTTEADTKHRALEGRWRDVFRSTYP